MYVRGLLFLCFSMRMRCSARRMSAGSSVWLVFLWMILLASSLFFSTPRRHAAQHKLWLFLIATKEFHFSKKLSSHYAMIKSTLTTKLLQVFVLSNHVRNVISCWMQVAYHSFSCIANAFVSQVSKGVNPGLNLFGKMKFISYFAVTWLGQEKKKNIMSDIQCFHKDVCNLIFYDTRQHL